MSLLPPSPFMNPSVISPRTEVSTADSECRLQNVARPDVTAERDPHPNPFLSDSTANTCDVESAVASKPPPAADAAAATFAGSVEQSTRDNLDGPTPLLRPSEILGSGASSDFPSSTGGPQEASAPAPTKNPDADALGTEFIHEIFFYARKLMKQPPRFVLDQARFLAEIEEVPLFIREDGYLKRQA